MKKKSDISELTGVYISLVENLRNLEDQISRLGCQIAEFDRSIPRPDRDMGSKIIAFPGSNRSRNPRSQFLDPAAILAPPGTPISAAIRDFRLHLQRDGLILLAWDKRRTEMGDRYTAYWVTSAGIPRFYASRPLPEKEFSTARPDHKSYAAEDGIEFYGQKTPAYLVHVAPELMMSNSRHGELRPAHIKMLQQQGSTVDFAYQYLLKKEKNRSPLSKKTGDHLCQRAGA